jgi:hypothetical protein
MERDGARSTSQLQRSETVIGGCRTASGNRYCRGPNGWCWTKPRNSRSNLSQLNSGAGVSGGSRSAAVGCSALPSIVRSLVRPGRGWQEAQEGGQRERQYRESANELRNHAEVHRDEGGAQRECPDANERKSVGRGTLAALAKPGAAEAARDSAAGPRRSLVWHLITFRR